MKKTTKLFAILLALVMMVGLSAACGAKETKTTKAPAEQTDTQPADKFKDGAEVAKTDAPGKTEVETTEISEETKAPENTTEPEVENNVAAIDWTPYDRLIADINAETDPAVREQLMHKAEDMLMDTGAIAPLYYIDEFYYMMKKNIKGVYTTPISEEIYFTFASKGGSDTLRIQLSNEPLSLDPALITIVQDSNMALLTFAGLYTNDKKGKPVPDLSESVEISEDGLTYTFTLKPDLKWSDGSELTAADFAWSWKRAAVIGNAHSLNIIEGYPDKLNVTASKDGRTLTVVLKAPTVHFLEIVAHTECLPVHQATVESAAGYTDTDGNILNPGAWALEAGFVSNGAFTLKEWKHNESMKYVKNPYYHRADEVKLESIESILNFDHTALWTAYEAGELDFIKTLPSDLASLADRPDFHRADKLSTHYILFNVKSDLFANKTEQQAKDMRHALSLLLDRERIANGWTIATSFIPPGMADGHGGIFKKNDKDYKYPVKNGYFPSRVNKTKAIELLEGAGYVFVDGVLSPDTPLSFEYIISDTACKAGVEALQQDFAQYGITMNIRAVEGEKISSEIKAGNFDVIIKGWVADFNDPINMLDLWTTESNRNYAQFGR